jgi:hypothetical protein
VAQIPAAVLAQYSATVNILLMLYCIQTQLSTLTMQASQSIKKAASNRLGLWKPQQLLHTETNQKFTATQWL